MDRKALLVMVLALALTLPACKKIAELAGGQTGDDPNAVANMEQDGDEPAEEPEKPADKPEKPADKPAQPDRAPAAPDLPPPVPDAAPDRAAAAGPVDESLFTKAYYEVTCVQSKIDDIEKQKAIIAEILPRYGFTDETYAAARTQLEGKENIKLVLASRMANCTKEAAMAFVSAGGADADMAADMPADMAADMPADKPKPVKPQPAYVGKLFARGLAAGDITQTEVMLNIQKDFLVLGSFKGLRDGKRFTISLRGNVDRGGSINMSGTMGTNRVDLRGTLTKNGASGTLSGSIYGKDFRANFNAPK